MRKHYALAALRESGYVARCHTMPFVGPYNLAMHCYGVASIIAVLHPSPSVNLLKAALFHDVPERWTGDIPNPAKDYIDSDISTLECDILVFLGLDIALVRDEFEWLKGADVFDLWCWAKTQHSCAIAEMRDCAREWIFANAPSEIREAALMIEERLPDRLPSRISQLFNVMADEA